jgi:hypothetical protein
MKSMVENTWGYYFYDSPQELAEDLKLVSLPLAGIDGKDVPELIDLLRQDKLPAQMRRNLGEHFGLGDNAECADIFNSFFQIHFFELRTIHDVVQNRKRKLTKREMAKYSCWAGLDKDAGEETVRKDILKRWKNSWFVQIIPKLEEEGFVVGISCFTNHDFFGVAFKDETGAFTVEADWLDDDMEVRLSYKTVRVLVSRGTDDNGNYYSMKGVLLDDKWAVRYAPEEFERPLMEGAGYKLSDNRFEGEYWFRFDTTSPAKAVRAIKALKRVRAKIKKHFDAIYKSVEFADEAEELKKESPRRALKIAERALELNPHNKAAKKMIKKLN